jgi:hypothetical protein
MIKVVALTQQLCSFSRTAKVRDARLYTNYRWELLLPGLYMYQLVWVVIVLKYHYNTVPHLVSQSSLT